MKTIYFVFALLAFVAFAPDGAKAQTMCTMEYAPVCGAKEVQCVTAPCPPVQQTYGNACVARADGAEIIHTGECGAAQSGPSVPGEVKPYQPPAACTAWYDGCNRCSRGPDGQTACTLRYCENPGVGYCTAYDREAAPTTQPDATTSPERQSTSTPIFGIATDTARLWQGNAMLTGFFENILRFFSFIPFLNFR